MRGLRIFPRLQWTASSLFALAVLLPSASLYAADPNLSHRVENLNYGQALYQYFQKNELNAITTLMVAKEKLQTDIQRDESDLLLADLYYGYGLYSESDRLFTRLLNDETSRSLKNRIWFNLARLNHDQGFFDNSRELLARTDEELPEKLHDEKNYLLTSLYLDDQQFDKATQASNDIDDESEWSVYAQYNLGVSMIEAGQFDRGVAWLQPLTEIEPETSEAVALLDQSNLTLGLSQLRQSQADQALETFQRIRLKGPLSNVALLGAGWAWDKLDRYEKALVPWLELAKNNSIDAATQEALLAIPTVLEKNKKPKLALQYYELAADRFDEQIKALNLVINTVRAGELVEVLQQYELLNNKPEIRNLPLKTTAAPYLHRLLASNEFQRVVKTYQDLMDIRSTLGHWRFNLPTLELMLAERRNLFQEKLPLLEQSSSLDKLEDYRLLRNNFAAKLDSIETNGDYQGLATVEEKELLQRLAKVDKSIEVIGDQRNTESQKDMRRLLSGLLDWEISTDYAPRLWRARKELIELDRALVISNERARSLGLVTQYNQQQFAVLEQRIDGQQNKVEQFGQRVADLILRQENRINQMAIQTIEAQQQHILQLRLNSRYSLARLYDQMAVSE